VAFAQIVAAPSACMNRSSLIVYKSQWGALMNPAALRLMTMSGHNIRSSGLKSLTPCLGFLPVAMQCLQALTNPPSKSAGERVRPNHLLKLTRYGMHCLAAPGQVCYFPSAAKQRTPPRSA
jgi:hypothetical protein